MKVAPLPHEWMIISIIGFFISVFQVWQWSKTWGFTFTLFFLLMFLASMVNMSSAGLEKEELLELAVHEQKVRAGKHRHKPSS